MIFLVLIVTDAALDSKNIKKEFLQAQSEKKKVLPCFHRDASESNIEKWGLNKLHGVIFSNEYVLAREVYSEVHRMFGLKHTQDLKPTQEEKEKTPEEEEESKFIIKKKGSSPSAKYNKASMEKAGIEALQMLMKEKTKEAARGKTRPSANVPDPQTSKMEDGFWVCRICGVKSLSDEEHEDHYRAVHHFGP